MKVKSARVIAITNNKGGVGKTTTAKEIARFLSRIKKKSLIIDMDPQSNISSQLLDSTPQYTMRDVLTDSITMEKAIVDTKYQNIKCIVSSRTLERAEIISNQDFQKRIGTIAKLFDYIVIDCPPALNHLTEISLSCADEILVPLKTDRYSADGLIALLDEIDNIQKHRNTYAHKVHIFLNEYTNTKLAKQLRGELQNIPGFMDVTIGRYEIIKRDSFTNQVSESEMNRHKVRHQWTLLFQTILKECE